MKWKATFLAAAFAAVSGTSLSAATINGTFDLGGNITASPSAITWSLTEPGGTVVANKALISGATGDYAGLNGTTVTIENLDATTEPTGSMFADQLFITFDAAPTLAPLDINFVFPGVFTDALCTASPAPGQTCTPNNLASTGQSPFSFINNPPTNHITSSATFALAGDEDTSFWNGVFTSQFPTSYQQVLSAFGPTGAGSVTNTYSATITTTATPETSTWSLLALGLGLVLVARSSGFAARFRRQN